MDTLPNGNLLVKGRREIRIDDELKVIEFSGVVRAWDIQPDNTIESELVADARVSYQGSGPLTRSTNRRGLAEPGSAPRPRVDLALLIALPPAPTRRPVNKRHDDHHWPAPSQRPSRSPPTAG